MKAKLTLIDGPHRSTVIRIGRGQVQRIGRTRWADVSLSADSQLAPVHFSAEYDGKVLIITDLSGGLGLQGPDGALHSGRLTSGTRFRAGQSEFLVELPTASPGSPTDPASGGSSAGDPPWNWRKLSWSKPAVAIADSATAPGELLALLMDGEFYSDAWLLVGQRAGPTRLVAWLANQILRDLESRMVPDDRPRFSAIQHWAEDPTPERFTEVLRQIPEELESPGAWLAQGVGWTASNLLPDDIGQVPMPPHLLGRACACAVTFLAIGPPPSPVGESQRRLLNDADRQFVVTDFANQPPSAPLEPPPPRVAAKG